MLLFSKVKKKNFFNFAKNEYLFHRYFWRILLKFSEFLFWFPVATFTAFNALY